MIELPASNKTLEIHDAVVNGQLLRNIPTRVIFVSNKTERNALENIEAGTIVLTFNLNNIWIRNGSVNTTGDNAYDVIKE
jgi:hypothetical protein